MIVAKSSQCKLIHCPKHVIITKQSRPSHVLLSATAYQHLIDKLTELEDAVWGQAATQALSKGTMVGSEAFTAALMEIANGET
jgi:PHD/YefM family antitoxin component YafN of YafNO toxin-antitoxin module